MWVCCASLKIFFAISLLISRHNLIRFPKDSRRLAAGNEENPRSSSSPLLRKGIVQSILDKAFRPFHFAILFPTDWDFPPLILTTSATPFCICIFSSTGLKPVQIFTNRTGAIRQQSPETTDFFGIVFDRKRRCIKQRRAVGMARYCQNCAVLPESRSVPNGYG